MKTSPRLGIILLISLLILPVPVALGIPSIQLKTEVSDDYVLTPIERQISHPPFQLVSHNRTFIETKAVITSSLVWHYYVGEFLDADPYKMGIEGTITFMENHVSDGFVAFFLGVGDETATNWVAIGLFQDANGGLFIYSDGLVEGKYYYQDILGAARVGEKYCFAIRKTSNFGGRMYQVWYNDESFLWLFSQPLVSYVASAMGESTCLKNTLNSRFSNLCYYNQQCNIMFPWERTPFVRYAYYYYIVFLGGFNEFLTCEWIYPSGGGGACQAKCL